LVVRLKIFKTKGFTLIETIVTIGVFAIISVSILAAFFNVFDIITAFQLNSAALEVLDTELEIVRNMRYEDVGTVGGSPSGLIEPERTIIYGGTPFLVKTTTRNIDDSFDGVIGGAPNDTAPADYKLVEFEISCPSCSRFSTLAVTTTISPKNLEFTTNNGALFINVFDAFGVPVSKANVSVANSSVNPPININDITDINGRLQFVDIATSTLSYAVTVSKNGYSQDKTYPIGDIQNPNPLKPHATVAALQVTQISFAVDIVSAFNFKTQDMFCRPVGDIDFKQTGAKLIGSSPDVLKYSVTSVTDSQGDKSINNLEWDTYNFQNLDTAYEIGGMAPLAPMVVNPGGSYQLKWLMETKTPLSLLISVLDASGASINDASVSLSKTGFNKTQISGTKVFTATDWSGASYDSQSGNIEDANPIGELKLKNQGGRYATSTEWLVSSTVDFGATNTMFFNLDFNPLIQPPQTGPDSLKIQIATNNDNATWNFLGPDGTQGTYYTVSAAPINFIHNNNRYLRYKVFFKTENENFTPALEDISFNFRSSCVISGQAFFSGLASGTYSLTIQKSGYQNFSDANVSVSDNWRELRVTLQP